MLYRTCIRIIDILQLVLLLTLTVTSFKIVSYFKSIRHPIYSPSTYNLPVIKLSSYIEQDSSEIRQFKNSPSKNEYQNDFINKSGSDYIVHSDDVSHVQFTCEAKYPISWEFPYPSQLDTMKEMSQGINSMNFRRSKFDDGMLEPRNAYYTISIVFASTYKFLSLNLTCRSVERVEKQSSIHVYLSDSYQLENQGETLQIHVDMDSYNTVTIPCRPSYPDAAVTLWKRSNQGGNEWSIAPTDSDKYISYSPKIGYTFTHLSHSFLLPSLDKKPTLKCNLTDGDEDDSIFVMINITYSHEILPERMSFSPTSKLSGNASVTLRNFNEYGSSNPNVACCTGVSSKPPAAIADVCTSPSDCYRNTKIIEDRLASFYFPISELDNENNCTSVYLYGSASILVFCQGDDLDFAEQYISILKLASANNSSILEWHNPNEKRNAVFGLTSEFIPYNRKIELEERVAIRILKPAARFTNYKFRNIYMYTQQASHSSYSDIMNNYMDVIHVRMYMREHLDEEIAKTYAGETLHFSCFSLKWFYATGAYLRINWKNGSKSVLQEKSGVDDISIFSVHEFPQNNVIAGVISESLIADLSMESVECFTPVWNTSGWDKLTYPLTFEDSVEPKFLGDEEETIYFNLHETGQRITCQLSQGLPTPEIEMTKDEKTIEEGSVYESTINNMGNLTLNDTTIFFDFFPITHEMHGEFQCTANNVKGAAVKIIRVIVSDNSNLLKKVMVWCFGVLLAMLGILVLCYIYRKRQNVLDPTSARQ